MKKLLVILLLLSTPCFAQSTATQTTPGYLTTSGCPGGAFSCFQPYSSTNPLSVAVIGTSGATAGYVYTSNGPGVAATFQAGGGSGSGTVTSVSVTSANGVSGTVANPTTTPAISLTLGAITPSSIVSSGAISGTTINGVALGTSGSSTTFLNGAGTYTTPSSGSITGSQYQVVTMTGTNTAAGNSSILTDASNDLSIVGAYKINSVNAISFPTSDTTAGASIAIGASALSGQTSSAAYGNTAVGYQALNGTMTTAGIKNVAIGYQSANGLTGGNNNVCIGASTCSNITSTSSSNVVIGAGANVGYNGVTNAVAIGYNVTAGLQGVVIGNGATDSGHNSLTVVGFNANGGYNGGTVFGFESGTTAVATAVNNAFFGSGGGTRYYSGTGGYNSGFGFLSLGNMTSGSYNSGFGTNAGVSITTGANNTVFGYNVASTTLATGSNNILIGTSNAVDTVASSTSNEINIGGLLFYNNNSTAAPTVSACGTNTIDTHANNKSGTVSITAGTPSSCTITFAGTGYSTWNHCRVASQGVNAAFAYSYTKTVLTVTGTALAGNIDYDCDGV